MAVIEEVTHTEMRDHIGREIGVVTHVQKLDGHVAYAWGCLAHYNHALVSWERDFRGNNYGSPKNKAVFDTERDALEWAKAKKSQLMLEVKSRPGVEPLDKPLERPHQMAARLGAKSLTNVSRKTGVQTQTLINWHANRYPLFDAICTGVAAKEAE